MFKCKFADATDNCAKEGSFFKGKKCVHCCELELYEVDTTEHKCAYCDAEGFCRNESHQGGGYKCCGCEDYTKAAAPVAVEAAVVPVPAAAPQNQLEKEAAYRLSRQYRKATAAFGAALEQVVCFGAMLSEWESYVGGWGKKGEGLKSWLANNCPEINYATAMGYKALGQKAAALIGGGAQALAVLNGRETVKAPGAAEETQVDQEVIDAKDALFHEATSRRKLEQLYFQFVGRDRPAKKPDGAPLPKLSKQQEATAIWTGILNQIGRNSVMDAVPLLGAKETDVCLDRIGALYRALKDHAKEF